MNKIYKTIWSKTRGMYIVVSELAHSHRGSVSGAARSTLLTACVLAAVGGLALQAEAANSVDYVSVKSNKSVSSAAGDDSVAIGPEAKAIAANTVALGHKVEANANKAVAVGTNNTVAQERGIAVGTDLSTVGKRTILMGSKIGTDPKKVEQTNIGIGVAILDWNVVSRPIILGRMAALAGANNPGANNIAVGNDFHLVNLPVEVDSTGTVKIKATKGNERGVAQDAIVFGNGAEDGKTYVVGNQSIVLGRISNSFLSDSISIGNDTKNVLGITIGNNAETQKAYSMALGTNAVAKEMQTVALGDESVADRKSGVLGYDPSTGQAFAGADKTAWQSGLGAVSVGKADATRQITNVSAGSEDTDAVNVAQLKSLDTKVTTEITNLKNRKTPFVSIKGKSGDGNFAGDGATGDVAIAIGPEVTAKGDYAVAMGSWTSASGANSLALGVLSNASGGQSAAIGTGANAKAADSIAFGTSTIAGASNAIALGASAKSNQFGGLAAGSKAEVASTGYNGIALGSNSYVGPKTTANPGDHSVPGNGLVIGPDVNDKEPTTAGMTEQNAMAIGQNAKAFGYQNTSLGAGAETHDTNTLAVGIAAIAKGDYAVALGKQAKTFAEKAIAAGWHASADEASAAAFGARAHATKANGLALGANSLVQDEASVALGSGTIASGAKDGQAYLSNEEVAKAAGIVSVGNPTYTITQDGTATEVAASYRRITNMAGGIDDHDAVNVAQLKSLNRKVDDLDAFNVKYDTKDDGSVNKNSITLGDTVISGVANGTKDSDAVNYGQLKELATQVEAGAVHYYSAKSNKTGAGSNYANDGAKAQDSIVLGISSTSEGINSTVIGNNNTLTGDKNGRNNSIVVGQNLTVEGTYNAVFGTDYNNYDTKTTHVAGEQNTVLGVGNLVGYTAEQDPNNPTKWIYTKKGKGSDQNVAVGLTNTANGGSVVVGTSSTAENLGSSFGHANKVIGSGSGGGQWGVALGNKLTAKGEMALAIGNETTAEGDWTVAIGSESSTAKNFDVAMGYQANASGGQSIAMGTVSAASGLNAIAMGTKAQATVDNGVALGSHSVADREAGTLGWDPTSGAVFADVDAIAAAQGKTDEFNAVKAKLPGLQADLEEAQAAYAADNSPENEAALNAARDNYNAAAKEYRAIVGAYQSGYGAVSVGSEGMTRQITNVAAGSEDTDAVNVAQLKKARTEVEGAGSITVTSKTGDDGQTIYTVTGTDNDTTYTAGDNITISADNVISATDTKVTAADLAVDAGKLNITVQDTAGNTVTGSVDLADITAGVADGNTTYELSGTENGNNTTTITLTDSDGNKNEVTVATKDTTLEESTSGLTVEDGKLNLLVKDSAGNEVTGSVDLSDIAAGVDTNTTYELSGQENDDNTTTITLTGSDGKTSDVTVATKDTRNTVTAGANVQVDEKKNDDGSSNYTVSVVTDGKVEKDNAGIVTGGTVYAETRVEQDGNYVKADNTAGQNITALDNQVKQNAVDIANIDNRVTNLDSRVTNMDGRIDRVGAGAAALAGLHPLDFDPDDKWDFAAAYGNYQGAHAVAIGAYYRPNEDTMFSVGGSFNGGENMLNVGVSWKFGQKNQVSRSRVSMAKDMLAMKAQIEALTARLAAYEAGQAGQAVAAAPVAGGSMEFPDVPENHWAYRYVQTLAARGYLQGYPDGEFKGDRPMTRYEYAAIIYRALQNGAPTDGDMVRSVDEFGAELAKVQNIDRFRVDRISGADDDRYKVERVRVNDKDNEEQNDFRDVYGSQIGR